MVVFFLMQDQDDLRPQLLNQTWGSRSGNNIHVSNVQLARGSSAHWAGGRIACLRGATSAVQRQPDGVLFWRMEKAGGRQARLQITTRAILGWGL